MKAVIMAGGEGTRLRPVTCNRPKPMVPLANKPVMEHIVELLKRHDFTDIAVTLQYMPDLIKEYFNDGSDFEVKMRYYVEKEPLGTAGSVKNAEEFLDETFLVISGDALTDIDLKKAVDFHKAKGSMATLVLKRVDIPLEYGVVVTDREGKITRFLEKPSWGEVFSDTVNTGIYILAPEVLGYFNKNEIFDFSKDLFPLLLKENKPMYGYVTEEYWCDIGDLNAYIQAHRDILDGLVKVNIPGNQLKPGIWVGEGTQIDDSVSLEAPCLIGKNCSIKKEVLVGKYSVLGNDCIINDRTGIKRSVVWNNALLDRNVQLRGSVICSKVHMKDDTSAFENSIIGDDTLVSENAIVKPNIKIWPNKLIDQCTEVNSNLVWGSKFTRSIFGSRGVAGEINVDITPEYASKLGAAYGAVNKGNKKIGVSSDNTTTSQMIKLSFISGLLSSGIEVYDMGNMLLPITRSAVRFYGLNGGIHISTFAENNVRLSIDFLDKNGCSIERGMERKIENAFIREDFSRCEGNCIKPVRAIQGYTEFYLKGVINNVKSEKLGYKIIVNSNSPENAGLVKDLLEDLNCTVEVYNLKMMNTGSMKPGRTSGDISQFASRVKMRKFDLGVSIENNAEKMTLVDEKGRIVTEDMFIALVSLIHFKTVKGGTVIIPVSASNVVERIAREYNGKVLRTKTSAQEIMGRLMGKERQDGMLDQFTMYFDAIAGLAKILDFVSQNNMKISELVDLIPEFHIKRAEVECPWNAKGKVIREIMQQNCDGKIDTIEGVKVYNNNGWVLVLPDADRPLCRVISEGSTEEFAEELTNIYTSKIKEISGS